jgi:hypothetical protein
VRCNQCDYPLWNLRSRICPECGTPFVPSDRDYVPNSVRFCCTNCGQDYYGTDEHGHLEPASFACVKCGEPQTMDEMVLLPTEGVEEEQTRVFVMPWLDGSYQSKRVRAWYATLGLTISSPMRLAQAVPEGASVARAWWFAFVSLAVFVSLGIGPITLLQFLSASRFGPGSTMSTLTSAAVFYAALLVGIALALGLWGLLAHGILKVSGQTAGTIGRTYQGLLYSSGGAFLTAIPFMGVPLIPIAVVWWVIGAAAMLTALQKVHWFRAAVASLVLPLLIFGVIVGAIALSVASTVTARRAAGAFGPGALSPSVVQGTQTVSDALLSYRAANGTDGPPHALALIVEGHASTSMNLIAMDTRTNETDVPLAGPIASNPNPTLLDLDAMDAEDAAILVDRAAAALPADVIAHRLGDFVFTYHGVVGRLSELTSSEGPLSGPTYDPGLWLVIYSPDPDVNFAPQPYEWLAVGRVDGAVVPMMVSQFPQELIEQNALRQAAGLPPLPDPRTVTHGAPAIAPDP